MNVTIRLSITVHDGDVPWRSEVNGDAEISLTVPSADVINSYALFSVIYQKARADYEAKLAEAKEEA